MLILAIDQASTSGWCFGDTRYPRNLMVGETKTHVDRESAIQSVRSGLLNAREHGADGFLRVVFEDHSDFYFARGNASVKALLGLGRAQGEWSAAILSVLSPESWHSVTPKVWRRAVLGLRPNVDSETAKYEALTWARTWLNRSDVGENAAEAACIWAWACWKLEGVIAQEAAERDAARLRSNEKARQRRAEKRKGAA